MGKLRLTILLSAAILASSLPTMASDSLFDAASARYIHDDSTIHFGPKAGNYRYDQRMIHAAELAQQRAHAHSMRSCWRYVKDALVAANVLTSRPGSTYAKQAGQELTGKYGFTKLKVSDPYKAPVGSVIVYGGNGAGHVEIRSRYGFVSDFSSTTPSHRPLIGVFVKPS
jgi:hypothetical protein